MSTSILVKKMEEAAETMDIDVSVEAKAMAEAQPVLDNYDGILLDPQVKYIENNIKSMTKKPVSIIDPKIYALGKGKEALELALEIIG